MLVPTPMDQPARSGGLMVPVVIIVVVLLLVAASPLIVARVSGWLAR